MGTIADCVLAVDVILELPSEDLKVERSTRSCEKIQHTMMNTN